MCINCRKQQQFWSYVCGLPGTSPLFVHTVVLSVEVYFGQIDGCVLNMGQKEDNKLSNKNDTGKNRMSFRVRPSSGDEESLLGA